MSSLDAAIESNFSTPAPGSVVALGDCLRQRFGAHALAILFYGSCRRARVDADGIVDLYVLVDGYRAAYERLVPAIANSVLAPNVYYLETPFAGGIARAKYAVVALDHFERGAARWFHSYLWGRFAQPCGLLFAADAMVRERVVRAIGAAIETFATRTLPRLPSTFDSETMWTQGLLLTYAAELRAERPERIRERYAEAASELDALTRAVGSKLGWQRDASGRYRNESTERERLTSARGWVARTLQGKALSIARLSKASFTFDGGLSYLVWKIERHSGVKVAITPFMRRFPRLGAIGAMWTTWRRGGFR